MTHCNASRREFTGQFGALLGAHSLGLMGFLGPSAAHAQAWPSRPVSMIAPYPAGGGVDTVARLIADQLATRLGQAVTIDNKPGAGATIGATLLARSAPDGYTLMLGSIVDYAIAPHIIKSLPFDMQRDLIPVVEIGFGTVGLIVNADLPATNLKELIAMARAKPGELSFASSGVGGLQHLNAEMFKQMAGVDILHVPYKGTAQFMPDLLSGRIPIQSLDALSGLKAPGARQIYFKYCSTFDSTAKGNIGPVLEAMMDALGTGFTIATPALPDNQRTVFKGYLFVGEVLLNESGMQNHPLTPMLDANLVRVLQAQTRRKVGLIDHGVVAGGAAAIAARIAALKTQNVGVAVVDAVSNDDLMRLELALKDMPLVAAGSGVAIGLPQNFGIAPSAGGSALPPRGGLQAVVSGSCSTATNRQVADFIGRGHPALALDPLQIADDVAKRTDPSAKALAWAARLAPASRRSMLRRCKLAGKSILGCRGAMQKRTGLPLAQALSTTLACIWR